jgi:hypothetical protein
VGRGDRGGSTRVPRGIALLAGGTVTPDDISFTLNAAGNEPQYSIGENKYLAENASTVSYTVTVNSSMVTSS